MGNLFSTAATQSGVTVHPAPPSNKATASKPSSSLNDPTHAMNSKQRQDSVKKVKPQNPVRYDGFPATVFELLVDFGPDPDLVIDDDFLSKLQLPQLIKPQVKKGQSLATSVAGVSQFKAQFEVPRDWFKRLRTVNPGLVLSSKAQYEAVWAHAVDCAVRFGHIESCGLDAEQRELEAQQVRGLINHPQFRLRTRAAEIARLEVLMRQKKKGSVAFLGIRDQINALKTPMKVDHSPSLRLMRNVNDISNPQDFKKKSLSKALENINEKTARALLPDIPRFPSHHPSNSWQLDPGGPESIIDGCAQRAGYGAGPLSLNMLDTEGERMVPRNNIKNTLFHDGFQVEAESTAPRLIVGGGPQRSGNNMIPLAFNRLQHRHGNPIASILGGISDKNGLSYETSSACKQAVPDPFNPKSENMQPCSGGSIANDECHKQLLSDLGGLISELAPHSNTPETGGGSSVYNSVFSSIYTASTSPSTSPDDNRSRNRSIHGFMLGHDDDFNAYTNLPESIDCHYRYYGPNMQICLEREEFMADSYAPNIPSYERYDEDFEMLEFDSSEVPLCVGLPPPQVDTHVGVPGSVPQDFYTEDQQLVTAASCDEEDHADGLPCEVGGYNTYGDISTEAVHSFRLDSNALAQMNGYNDLITVASWSSDRLPKPPIESWSELHGTMMID